MTVHTFLANPKQSLERSSTELTATPPQARVNLSMFLRLALRKARIPNK